MSFFFHLFYDERSNCEGFRLLYSQWSCVLGLYFERLQVAQLLKEACLPSAVLGCSLQQKTNKKAAYFSCR